MSSNNKGWSFWQRVFISIIVLLIVGAVFDAYAKWKEKNLSNKEKLARLRKDEDRYYRGLNKAQINEKWIYFTARTLIALCLLVLNVWYFYFVADQELGKTLNLNEAIILSYSFVAFIIAGTPSNFVQLLRSAVINLRRRWHVGKLDIEEIKKEIDALELKIAEESRKN